MSNAFFTHQVFYIIYHHLSGFLYHGLLFSRYSLIDDIFFFSLLHSTYLPSSASLIFFRLWFLSILLFPFDSKSLKNICLSWLSEFSLTLKHSWLTIYDNDTKYFRLLVWFLKFPFFKFIRFNWKRFRYACRSWSWGGKYTDCRSRSRF